MANRKIYYFKQPVTETELNAGFAYLEAADRALMTDQAFVGVLQNGGVVQHTGTPNLSVDIAGNAVCYDQNGQRISWPTTQNVDVSQDSTHVSTSVAGVGNEKWVSVFAQFVRVLSDPRTDGNNTTVYFDQAESFQFLVTQGAEATIGSAPRPALQSVGVLLADVHMIHSQTQVLNADIDVTTRRQDIFVIPGALYSIRRGTVKDVLSDMNANLNTLGAITGGGFQVKTSYAAIQALAAPSLPTIIFLAQAGGQRGGLYYWDAASTDADDTAGASGISCGTSTTDTITLATTVKPTAVGGGSPGRWLLQRDRYTIVYEKSQGNTGEFVQGTTAGGVGCTINLTTKTGISFPANSLRAGDIIEVEADLNISTNGPGTGTPTTNMLITASYGLTIGGSGASLTASAPHQYSVYVEDDHMAHPRARYVVQSADVTHTIVILGSVLVQEAALDGVVVTVTTSGAGGLRARVIRP